MRLPALAAVAVFAVALLALTTAPAQRTSAGGAYGITIGSASGPIGGPFTVEVAASAPESGIGSFTFDIFFDDSRFTPTACTTTFAGCNKAYLPAQVRVAGVPFTPLVGQHTVATITFQAKPGASGTSALDLTTTNIFSAGGEDIASQTAITDGQLTITSGPPVIKPGDANCDGSVNELDGLAILNYLSGSQPEDCIADADYNCDLRVDVKDAIAILQGLADVDGPSAC